MAACIYKKTESGSVKIKYKIGDAIFFYACKKAFGKIYGRSETFLDDVIVQVNFILFLI